MNLKLKPGRGSRVIAGVVFLCSLTLPAYAQLVVSVTCGTSTMDLAGGPGESCGQTIGTSSGGLIPGEIITRELSGSAPTSSFSTSASARADYGSLGIAGTASLVNASVNAANFDDPVFSTRTASVSASSGAQWHDRVTVSGAPGSFVDVLVSFVVDIHSFDTSALGGVAGTGFIRFNTNLSDRSFCMGDGGFCGTAGSFSALTLGTNLFSFTTQMAAGALLDFSADFHGQVTAFHHISTAQDVANGMTAGSASTAYDALNTARTYFTVLTDGATMSWASGHDYSAPVAVTPVPEPSTYALMLAGLGLVGWIARKRKATEAAAA